MAQGSTFPIFIRPELQDGAPAFAEFKRIAGSASKQAADSFKADFNEVTSVISNALTKGVQGGKLNLDVSQLRQASADAKLFGSALTDTLRTAQLLAKETGDTSAETRQFILAIEAASRAQDENRRGIDAQIATYTRLQAGLDATSSSNSRLAQSYRETYAEAAKMAGLEVANGRLSGLIAPASSTRATDKGAGYGALAQLAQQQDETERLARSSEALSRELDVLRRAEVGVAESARIIEGAYRGTSAAIDATAKSAAESAAVFQRVFDAQAEVSSRRFQSFISPAASTSALQNGAGYAELEKAARAADEYERELAELRQQVDPLAFAQARVNKELAFADDAFRRGDISADQLTQRQTQLNGALGATREGLRATQQASVMAGQQLQDIAISLYSGQRAGVVFAQQLPQLAYALSALEGSANKTASRIGQFATFLSGPWGLAVGLGVGVLATLTAGLFDNADAAGSAEKAQDALAKKLADIATFFDLSTGAVLRNNEALIANARLQRLDEIDAIKAAQKDRSKDIRSLVSGSMPGEVRFGGTFGNETGRVNIQRSGPSDLVRAIEAANGSQKEIGDALLALARDGGANSDRARRILELRAQAGSDAQSLRNLTLEEDSLRTGKLASELREAPSKRTPRRSGAGDADKARKAAEQLENAIDQSAESVARLREQFDEAPRDIDRANKAAREFKSALEEVNEQLTGKKLTDANRKKLEETKKAIEDAQTRILPNFRQRPVDDRIKDMDKELQLQRLILSGRDDEVDLLSFQHDLMRQLNVQTQEQLEAELRGRNISKEKLDLMYLQFQQLRDNARAQERMDRSVRSVSSKLQELDRARSSIEQSIAGLPDNARASLKGLVGSLRAQVNEIIARRITDNLFGNLFAKIEGEIKGKRPIDVATDDYIASTVRANTALIDLTETFIYASSAFRGAANDNPVDKIVSGATAVAAKAASKSLANAYDPNAEIVVTAPGYSKANREQRQANAAMEASAKSLKDLARSAAEGAFIGQSASSLVFGGKSNATGSAIGGALGKIAGEEVGKMLGGTLGKFAGPLGSIAGGLLGSMAAGLLTKTPRGFATIGGSADGKLGITGTGGNSNSAIKAGNQAAGATLDTLDQIAQALGGNYDASRGSVSIGRSGDSWHVDTSGQGRLKKSQGGFDFDDDYESAVRFATMDLIKDGVISGLRASTQRLLQQGKDIDAALQKALDFESVFTRLKEYKDPVGAALDGLDREFVKLDNIFKDASASAAEFAQLEELYGLERAKAIEEAASRITGSLQSLFDDLTIGDNGRSLRDRLGAAQAAYDPLKARVLAGDKTAYDAYAEAAKSLLDIQRQFSGSQTPYFSLLDEITKITKDRIDAEKNISSIAENRDSPFSSTGKATGANDNAPVVGAIQQQTSDLLRGFASIMGAGGSGVDYGFKMNSFR